MNDMGAGLVLGYVYSKDPDAVMWGISGAVALSLLGLAFGLCWETYKSRKRWKR